MNEIITKQLEQDKTRLVIQYNTIEQSWVATIQRDEGTKNIQWWECEFGVGNTVEGALKKLTQHIEENQP